MKKTVTLAITLLILMAIPCLASGYTLEIPAQYDTAQPFQDGIALVTQNGRYGVIDKHGNTVMDFDESKKCVRANGLIMVLGDNDMAAFFDKSGRQLTEYIYDTYPDTHLKTYEKRNGYFTNQYDGDGQSDLIPVSRGKKFGFLNSAGTEQIAPAFDYAYGFYEGMARICADGVLSNYGTYTNGKYGFINEAGEIIVPADSYWTASDFHGGFAAVSTGGISMMLDESGNTVNLSSCSFQQTNGKYIEVKNISDEQTAVLDMQQNVIVPFDYSLKDFDENYIYIDGIKTVNGKNEVLYTAAEGHMVSPAQRDGFVSVRIEVGDVPNHLNFGLLSKDFRELLPVEYEQITVLGDGIIYAKTADENFLFDYEGDLICKLGGNDVYFYSDGLFGIKDFTTMKYGYVKNPLLPPTINVTYNDEKIKFTDAEPIIYNSRTLVPLRAVFEAIGAQVTWEADSRTAVITKNETVIRVTVGDNVMYKDSLAKMLDVPARIKNSRTLLPLRAVSEGLGCSVGWSDETHTVDITD